MTIIIIFTMILYIVQATPKPHPQLTQSRLFETTFEHLRIRPNIKLKSHTKSNRDLTSSLSSVVVAGVGVASSLMMKLKNLKRHLQ